MLWEGYDTLVLNCYPNTVLETGVAVLARYGALECLKYVHKINERAGVMPWNNDTATSAVFGGHLAVLKFVLATGAPYDLALKTTAAANGRLDCLQYLHDRFNEWEPDATILAAKHGHLACLVFAHENGCPWRDELSARLDLRPATTRYAAEYGHLDCLMYAHEHGCPWHEATLTRAICEKQRECAIYVASHGWDWIIHDSLRAKLQKWIVSEMSKGI
jgi:hypothetical protein